MNASGQEYVKKMREKSLSDVEIKQKLSDAGWEKTEIDNAFGVSTDLDTPPPPPHTLHSSAPTETVDESKPIAVVAHYSTLGIEYSILMISLITGAISLGAILNAYIEVLIRHTSADISPFASAAAVVALPIFIFMFIRLRRLEMKRPQLKADGSRRRWIQVTLLISFVFGISHIIFYVYSLMAGNPQPSTYSDYGVAYSISAGEYQLLQFLHLAITLLIAGSIFAYYWIDEHRQKQ